MRIDHISRALIAAVCLSIAGCDGGEEETRIEVTDVRQAPVTGMPVPQPMGAEERLLKPGTELKVVRGEMPAPAAEGESTWDYTLPEGWEALPATQFRLINLRVAAEPKAEAYFSIAGGSLADNINRWRAQLGLQPAAEAEIAALPKQPLLGQQATFVSFDGTYTGMRNEMNEPNYRLLGLALVMDDGRAAFVKMTGPTEVLAQQEANFLAFAATIHEHAPGAAPHAHAEEHAAGDGHAHAPGEEHAHEAAPPAQEAEKDQTDPTDPADPVNDPEVQPAAAAPTPAPAASAVPMAPLDPAALKFTAPPHWKQNEKPMRIVSFTIGDDGATECYVSALAGTAGGVEMNLNRWRNQMGAEPLSPEEIAALPKIQVAGVEAPVIEVKGPFTDMQGNTKDQYMLLGTVAVKPDQVLFIKMTGPESVVQAERENFLAFAQSLQ